MPRATTPRPPAKRIAAPKKASTRAPKRVAATRPVASDAAPRAHPRSPTPLSGEARERRFNLLLQAACLKAGSAAAVTAITAKVPLLGRLAPVLVGSVNESMALGKLQQQLVRDTLDLYELQLSELEERGVILLATAGTLGAKQLSSALVDQLVAQVGNRYLRLIAARALPMASVVTEIAGAIASTYTVGKRAQVLCNLPGSGARNLGELLRGLTGIDQRRLLAWSGEALKLSLVPFRSVLSLLPKAMGR